MHVLSSFSLVTLIVALGAGEASAQAVTGSDATDLLPGFGGSESVGTGGGGDGSGNTGVARAGLALSGSLVNDNQAAVAGALSTVGADSALVGAVLETGVEDALDALTQLAGEIYPSLSSLLIESSGELRRAAQNRLEVDGALSATAGAALWARPFGNWTNLQGEGVSEIKASTGGVFFGFDGEVGGAWRLGAIGGYSQSSVDGISGTSANIDAYSGGLYGGRDFDALSVSFGAAYALNRIDTSRRVAFGTIDEQLEADYDATTTQVFAEAVYETRAGAVPIQPFLGLNYVNVDSDGFTETGGIAALDVESARQDAWFSTLGLRADSELTFGLLPATVTTKLGWRHLFGDSDPRTMAGLAAVDTPFGVSGTPVAEDAFYIEAGVDATIAQNVTLGLGYAGQFGDDVSVSSARLTLVWTF